MMEMVRRCMTHVIYNSREPMKRCNKSMIFLFMLPVMVLSVAIEAQRINTRINVADSSEHVIDNTKLKICLDKNSDDSLLIKKFRFFGFDKPVASSKESFFMTNASEIDIVGIEIEIEYLTTDLLSLHKRTVLIDYEIPSGETRKIDIKSWDEQESFYYCQSVRPHRQATPFEVRFNVISYYIIK